MNELAREIWILGWDGNQTYRSIFGSSSNVSTDKKDKKVHGIASNASLGHDFVFIWNSKENYSMINSRWEHSRLGEQILSIFKTYVQAETAICEVKLGNSFVIFLSSSTIYFHKSFLPKPVFMNIAVQSVSCGSNHAIVLTRSSLFAIGSGPNGELGLGESKTIVQQFEEISIPCGEVAFSIAAGSHHSCFITKPHGYVYSFGCGAYYRLGHGNDSNQYYPKRIEALIGVGDFDPITATTLGIKLVACGEWHTIAVSNGANDVYGWGWNKFGQLGDLEEQVIEYPERISIFNDEDTNINEDILQVACGSSFSALTTSSNRFLIMGCVGRNGAIPGIDRDFEVWKAQSETAMTAEVLREWTLSRFPDQLSQSKIQELSLGANVNASSSIRKRKLEEEVDDLNPRRRIVTLSAMSNTLAVVFS